MDSSLDLKFKRLMKEYFPGKKEKINPKYITQINQPYLFKQIKLHKRYSKKKTINKKLNESPNILFIKLKSPHQKNKGFKFIHFSPKTVSSNSTKDIKLASTDILQDKTFYNFEQKQFCINSLINQLKLNKNRRNHDINIRRNISEFEFNKLCNLKLTPLKEKKNFNVQTRKTKFAMLINLYHKYSSTSSGCIKKNKDDSKIDKYYKKVNSAVQLMKENSKFYMTYYNPNMVYNFNNIYKRNLNLPGNQINNNKIINKDNKIHINCLMSNKNSEINTKKIFQKLIGKTMYNLQKDNTYIRIQNLDNIFYKIMKK